MPNLPFDVADVVVDGQEMEYGMVPEGDYEVRVTKTELRTAKSGTDYLNVEFTIEGPTQKNRKVWDNHFIYSEKAYPRVKFKQMVMACGLNSIKTTEELHGRTCIITVKHDGKYENVTEYAMNTSGPAKPAAAPSTAPKPVWAA